MVSVVTHFGVHWEGQIAFLLQERVGMNSRSGQPETTGTNALGLPMKSFFKVQTANWKLRCNHNINLASTKPNPDHWAEFIERVYSDQLIEALLPVPKMNPFEGAYFLDQRMIPPEHLSTYLTMLAGMSSPIRTVIRPIWTLHPRELVDEMSLTNVQPLILTGAIPDKLPLLENLGELVPTSPRTVLVVGSPDVPAPAPFKRITTRISERPIEDCLLLPWAQLGATALRRYMRDEPME